MIDFLVSRTRSLSRPRAARIVDHDRDALVARYELVPELGHRVVAGEHVDLLALHADAAILGDEAAVVDRGLPDVARQPIEFGDVNRCVQRDDVGVHGDRQKRRDRVTRSAASPWIMARIELVEADALASARTRE